ncbi:hypothetical protein [Herbiconiux sp.]|uniref:hypothetical protein n=1 Tax=Herbiconiux sp. TaxID=1871186 RepID=UPI0025BEB630|nr:hypothetical protein [Herbiconiux sp.]
MTTDRSDEGDLDDNLHLLYENARRMEAANEVITQSQIKHGMEPYGSIIVVDGPDDPVNQAIEDVREAIKRQTEIMALLPKRLTE